MNLENLFLGIFFAGQCNRYYNAPNRCIFIDWPVGKGNGDCLDREVCLISSGRETLQLLPWTGSGSLVLL